MTEAQEPRTPAEQDVWPTILELQKVLVERLRGAVEAGRLRPPDEVAAISFTSCDHHSCQ
jgi:hypothetical protein